MGCVLLVALFVIFVGYLNSTMKIEFTAALIIGVIVFGGLSYLLYAINEYSMAEMERKQKNETHKMFEHHIPPYHKDDAPKP